MNLNQVKTRLPLLLIMALFILFFVLRLDQYVSFANIKQHHQQLLRWTHAYYVYTVLCFFLIYALTVAASLPGATLLTVISGFLFGVPLGTLYVVFSATLGATLLFLAIHFALKDWLVKKNKAWMDTMKKGIQRDAYSYLFFLRLMPIFPFWVVNIIPALLEIPLKTFIITTFFGIIPGTLIYVSIGNGLGYLIEQGKEPKFSIIFAPQIFWPLVGLALLSLVPMIYRRFWKRM